MQLLMHSVDTSISYSTYLPIFRSQKGFVELQNNYLITAKKGIATGDVIKRQIPKHTTTTVYHIAGNFDEH